MKINYFQMFDLVDEYAVEMLISEETAEGAYETTIHGVYELMGITSTTVKKMSSKKKWILLVAAVFLMTGGLAFASSDGGARLIDEFNRYLIGKVEKGTGIIYENEDSLIESVEKNQMNYDVYKTSSVIKVVEKGMMPPKSVMEFETICSEGKFITPEVMFSNGDFVIFTNTDNNGWYLEEGDLLGIEVNEYKSEVNDGAGQSIVYYLIVNGVLMKDSVYAGNTLEQRFELNIEKDGEYLICLGCNSSDRISLKEGNIYVRKVDE